MATLRSVLRHSLMIGSMVWVFLLFFSQAVCSQTIDYTPLKAHISALIEQKMQEYTLTGVSIALVDEQDIVWSQGFGYANKAANIPATGNTVYRVGALSALLTTMAILQLHEQGKLDIEQPLTTYIPEFRVKSGFPEQQPITLRALMAHRSGLFGSFLWLKGYPSFRDILRFCQANTPFAPPNTKFIHSDVAIDLLGLVIEQVSGLNFEDYMTKHLLQRLNMNASAFSLTPKLEAQLAGFYKYSIPRDDPMIGLWPSESLYASVADLAQFMIMVNNAGQYRDQAFLQPETIQRMLRLYNEIPPTERSLQLVYTRFLAQDKLDIAATIGAHGAKHISHWGAMIVLPERKLGVVTMTNDWNGKYEVFPIAAETMKQARDLKIVKLKGK